MDLIGFLYGFGLLHGLILAGVLLYSSGGNRLANACMAGLVSCIAIRFLFSWLVRTDVFMSYPQWSMWSHPLDFAWGPLLFLYAYAMTSQHVRPTQLLHFIPFLLLLSEPITFMSYPKEQQVAFLGFLWSDRENVELGRQLFDVIPAFWRVWIDLHLHGIMFSIQFAVYCVLVLLRIRRHKQKLEQNFSFTERMDLHWLRTLTLLCVLFLVFFLIFNRANIILFGHLEITAIYLNLPFLFMVFAIYIIGIQALRQPSILRGVIEVDDETEEQQEPEVVTVPQEQKDQAAEIPRSKYTRSGINLEDAQRYKIRMMKTMQDQELYLDCDLTLRQLARHVGISYHQASQVINGQMNQRFFSFVNNYRVQLAKDLMSDPKTSKMAIVDLAVEVGFKSKSSFYDAFKKVTEMTPTQFKKSLESGS